jgi:hypothetical protein
MGTVAAVVQRRDVMDLLRAQVGFISSGYLTGASFVR